MKIQRVEDLRIQNEAIYIEEGNWQQSQGGILVTKNAQSCAIIAVTSLTSNIGYLGHFKTPWFEDPERKNPFDEFVEAIRTEEANNDLSAWIGGVTLIDDPSQDAETLDIYHAEVERDKSRLALAVRSLGREVKLKKRWGKTNEIIDAQLYCDTGYMEYAVRKIHSS